MTNGNRKSNIRPSIYTIENYLQNHIHQQRIVPGKAVVIGDSHVNRINKSSFKNNSVGHAVYFKCFSGLNMKQLNYYTNPN